MSSLIDVPRPPYTWATWLVDNHTELWNLYHALTRSAEATGPPRLLDGLTFGDFAKVCVKHTSRPVDPFPDPHPDDLEPPEQPADEDEDSAEDEDIWWW